MGGYWRNTRTIPIANGSLPVRWDGRGLRRHSTDRPKENKREEQAKDLEAGVDEEKEDESEITLRIMNCRRAIRCVKE